MFDQVVVRPRRRPIQSVLIVGSAIIHAAVVAGLVVAGMWQVDRVAMGPEANEITFRDPMPSLGAAALPAGKPQTVDRPKIVKVKPDVPVQPLLTEPEVTLDTGPATGDDTGKTGGGQGTGCRPADAAPGEGTDLPPCSDSDLPPCEDPPCSEDGEPTVPEVKVVLPPPPPPPNVPPTVAKGLRMSGDEQIYPPRDVQLTMVRNGHDTVRGTFQLCVDEGGTVSSVRRLRTTGYDGYDAELVRAMHGWRYRPYLVAGKAAPMCTVQVFVYRIKS